MLAVSTTSRANKEGVTDKSPPIDLGPTVDNRTQRSVVKGPIFHLSTALHLVTIASAKERRVTLRMALEVARMRVA